MRYWVETYCKTDDHPEIYDGETIYAEGDEDALAKARTHFDRFAEHQKKVGSKHLALYYKIFKHQEQAAFYIAHADGRVGQPLMDGDDLID